MGMYFTAILAAKGNEHLRQLVLQQVDAIVRHNAAEQDSDVAVQHWMWDDADRSLLCMRYFHLKLTEQYLGAWRGLAAAGIHGVHSLLRTEHDLLLKVRAIAARAMCCITCCAASSCCCLIRCLVLMLSGATTGFDAGGDRTHEPGPCMSEQLPAGPASVHGPHSS
jgi:hypothetical protein